MAAQEKKDHVSHRRGRRALGALADAVHDESVQLRRRLPEGGGRLPGHPRLSPVAVAAEVSVADRSPPGRKGRGAVQTNCARCHGTYGEKWTYPNKIVPLDKIGTDRHRFDGITAKFGDYYNKSWFNQDMIADSRDQPGLPGPAAGRHLGDRALFAQRLRADRLSRAQLEGAGRRLFTRSYRTDLDAYDAGKLGWKVEVLTEAPDAKKLSPIEYRKIYDTTRNRPRQRRPHLRRQAERRRAHGGD